MNKHKISIFNDVLGPVMTGPSSSHTAAPGRIGYFISKLSTGFSKVRIAFPACGSYAGTYRGQKSDVGFIAGLMGIHIDDIRFKNALEIARAKGIEFEFNIVDIPAAHPNACTITLENGPKQLRVESISTGGGAFEITSINGTAVQCRGDCHELIGLRVTLGADHILNAMESTLDRMGISFSKRVSVQNVIHFNIDKAPANQDILVLNTLAIESGWVVRHIPPILPVTITGETMPFSSAKELCVFLDKNPMPLWQGAALYESIISGWDEGQVLDYAEGLVAVMKKSVQEGLKADSSKSGFTSPSAHKIRSAKHRGILLDTGVIGDAVLYSTAVMEQNNSMGIIVASPTAGSCGVVPGVLFGIGGLDCMDTRKGAKALLCAGLIGVFIAKQATFAAEVAGCQAECGAASAMAAAVASFSTNTNIILNAASMALQNTLGLICDPVGGRVEIPCVSRNAMAAANAIVSANMSLGGFDAVIPLDETIKAMLEVGKMLPRELRCTGLGGLCNTDTGRAIAKSWECCVSGG